MTTSVIVIPFSHLLIALLPAMVVLALLWHWSLGAGEGVYALARMAVQLIGIGYVLTWLLRTDDAVIVGAFLLLMLLAAGWIAVRPVRSRPGVLRRSLLAIGAGSLPVLFLMTEFVLRVGHWYEPHVVIPLAGMVLANSMNTVSLAAERFVAERSRDTAILMARNSAMQAALLPTVNSLLAVGIVSLPGMMTGQILSGVDPLLAVRYQVMVMAMIFAASGLAAGCYLAAAVRAEKTNPAEAGLVL
mgnify:CR=1 FL=1